MNFKSIRFPALAIVFLLAMKVGATLVTPDGNLETRPPALLVASLPASADFPLGSSVLSIEAQVQLVTVLSRFKARGVDSVVVTSFSNTSVPEQRDALALERARSVKAFFTLHGVNPQSIAIRVVAESISGEGRAGQVFFGVVGIGG